MTPRRVGLALGAAVTAVVAGASPAAAHGVGALSGLPLPRWQFAWAIAAVVVIAFFAAGTLWRRPRLEAAAAGRAVPGTVVIRVLAVALRTIGVVAYVVIVTAGLFGSVFPAANIAPIGVLITFWVGLQFVSILFGDLWRVLSPFETLALVGSSVWSRLRRRPPPAATTDAAATHWPAVVAVGGFVWLELAYHAPTVPRTLGGLALAYGVVVLTIAARRGRAWLRTGEGFAAWFSVLAAMAPLHRDGQGGLRARWPLSGLSRLVVRPGTLPLLFVVLGAAVFDGLTRTRFWSDLTLQRIGWGYTAVNTLGLLWAVGIVALVYLGTTRIASSLVGGDPDTMAQRFAPVLVPLVAAYTVAHYVGLFVLDGQGFWFLASDPYGEGWDLFGTADGTIDFTLASITTIAWIQAVAIALGGVGAVLVAHDRAIADLDPRPALITQYVLLAFTLTATTGAVALLLGT